MYVYTYISKGYRHLIGGSLLHAGVLYNIVRYNIIQYGAWLSLKVHISICMYVGLMMVAPTVSKYRCINYRLTYVHINHLMYLNGLCPRAGCGTWHGRVHLQGCYLAPPPRRPAPTSTSPPEYRSVRSMMDGLYAYRVEPEGQPESQPSTIHNIMGDKRVLG